MMSFNHSSTNFACTGNHFTVSIIANIALVRYYCILLSVSYSSVINLPKEMEHITTAPLQVY